MTKQNFKFGCWPSTVSAEFVAGKALRFQTVHALRNILYWSESRPLEKGRAAVMCAAPGSPPKELLPAPYSAQSKVHEYGGNPFLVTGSALYFVNGDDQDIWSLPIDHSSDALQKPRRLTDAPDWRFADLILDAPRHRLICVAEHREPGSTTPKNLLVSVSLEMTGENQITALVKGDDFYASPRLSPDGDQLAFLSWNLPSMPWQSAQLQIATLGKTGDVTTTDRPSGFDTGASFQPEWDEDGTLWFINDKTGFGQLYRLAGRELTMFPCKNSEMGAPLWVFGMKTYGFLADGRIAALALSNGRATINLIDPVRETTSICTSKGLCALDQLVTIGNDVAGIFSRLERPQAIACFSIKTEKTSSIRSSATFDLPAGETSIAQILEFENERGERVFGNYYPPTNHAFEGPANDLPPVILTAHGGPTAFSDCGLKPKTQYWTSRGFGYFDVNYSGSWGFGKPYRERLDGEWGNRDVADMVAAGHHLVKAGLAHRNQLLISGSSAGGYTVLMALVTSDLFAAGASYYGISDLARLATSTHKFEAGYIETLLGLTAKNKADILKARSPLSKADQISAPVIFFQGRKDKVVPPDQAELMVKALKKQGLKVHYRSFEEEGHGFRRSETVETALTLELAFYRDVLKL